VTQAVNGGKNEVDDQFHSILLHPGLCYFKKGISLTTQWSGMEFKNMGKVFFSVLAGAHCELYPILLYNNNVCNPLSQDPNASRSCQSDFNVATILYPFSKA